MFFGFFVLEIVNFGKKYPKKVILSKFDLFSKNHFFWPLGGENTQKTWENRIFQKIAPRGFRVISTTKTMICNFLDLKNEIVGEKYP